MTDLTVFSVETLPNVGSYVLTVAPTGTKPTTSRDVTVRVTASGLESGYKTLCAFPAKVDLEQAWQIQNNAAKDQESICLSGNAENKASLRLPSCTRSEKWTIQPSQLILRCARCLQPLTSRRGDGLATFDRVLPMPSANWREMSEFWYCHKENLKGRLPQNLSLTTRERMLLYSHTTYQVHPHDVRKGSVRLESTRLHAHTIEENTRDKFVTLKCSRCRARLGHTLTQRQSATPRDTRGQSDASEKGCGQSDSSRNKFGQSDSSRDNCGQSDSFNDGRGQSNLSRDTRAHAVTERSSDVVDSDTSNTNYNSSNATEISPETNQLDTTTNPEVNTRYTETPTTPIHTQNPPMSIQTTPEDEQLAGTGRDEAVQLNGEATFYRDMVTTGKTTRSERQNEKIFVLTHKLLQTAEKEVTYRLSIRTEGATPEEPMLLIWLLNMQTQIATNADILGTLTALFEAQSIGTAPESAPKDSDKRAGTPDPNKGASAGMLRQETADEDERSSPAEFKSTHKFLYIDCVEPLSGTEKRARETCLATAAKIAHHPLTLTEQECLQLLLYLRTSTLSLPIARRQMQGYRVGLLPCRMCNR